MAKAATAKRKSKTKPKLKLSNKEQSERFTEAARQLGVEKTEQFDAAFDRIVGIRDANEK